MMNLVLMFTHALSGITFLALDPEYMVQAIVVLSMAAPLALTAGNTFFSIGERSFACLMAKPRTPFA